MLGSEDYSDGVEVFRLRSSFVLSHSVSPGIHRSSLGWDIEHGGAHAKPSVRTS
jgi:hypothetical protein